MGLSEEQRGHLFQVFEQVDGGSSRRFGGTGLGLALCRELAALMGGNVGVDSQPRAGSTFWFEAPFEVGVDVTPIEQAGVAAPARQAGSRRILLVDDDAINNEVAEFLLRLQGFEVDIACDGAEAVERAASEAYAAMLMDIQMPHLDGLEATRLIRRLPEHAATPIIAMTASVFEEDRRACSEAGMSDLVAKPIDPAHLSSVLARWVPAIIRQLDELPAVSVATSSPVRAGPTPHQQLLRLQQLIVTDDIEAREYFRTLPPQVCGPEQFELRRHLDDFDYDQAAILVTRRLQHMQQEQAGT
jgi:CheY-like chemotaxis protein